jgi:hypothetical protein
MDFALVDVLQRPSAVDTPARMDDIDSFGEARVARRLDNLEKIESPQNVIVPSRRKSEAFEFRPHDIAGAVGTKEPVDEEELAATPLRQADLPRSSSAMELVQVQALKYADGRIDRGMGCSIWMSAIPPPIKHLLLKQIAGDRVETLVVVLKVGKDGKHHAGNTCLASVGPF